MTRADWLGVAGLLVSIILGLPSFSLFARGDRALGIAAIILAGIVLALTWAIRWILQLPPWTIMRHRTRIEVLDPGGKQAVATKTLLLRPNHGGLQHYTHRNISGEGTPVFAVDPAVVLLKQQRSAGDYFVTVEFPHQLRRFEKVTTWLEMRFADAYCGDPENFTLLVDQPMREVSIEVILPESRHPHSDSVMLLYRYSGKEEQLEKPQVQGRTISWTRVHKWRGLPPGEYEIRWNW
jgi:hypothetical protein